MEIYSFKRFGVVLVLVCNQNMKIVILPTDFCDKLL